MFLLLAVSLHTVMGQALVPVPCTLMNNTLGSCECPGQLFVAEECHKGFYCLSEEQFPGYDGCEIMCAEDQVLIVDPRNGGGWSCQDISENQAVLGGICPGKFNTECGCDPTAPSSPSCEIGECECEGQLWVSQDCKKARYCDSNAEGGFMEQECQGNQIVYVNMADLTWSCDVDDGRCPGSFHVGCEQDSYNPGNDAVIPIPCTLTNNTLGTCTCPGQLFIAEECHKGFYCLDEDRFPGYDGCEVVCGADQVLIVDPRNGGGWECKTIAENQAVLGGVCPGKFNTECGCNDASNPDCEIGECSCEGQLWVSQDCKTARFCDSSAEGGYVDNTCQGNQIVYVNMADHTWSCGVDDGRCPGSFHVGCRADNYDPGNGNGSSAFTALSLAGSMILALLIGSF